MRWVLAAALAAGVGLSIVDLAAAQSEARPVAPSAADSSVPVVVLDVAVAFKNHARFRRQLEEVRRDREDLQKEFSENRDAVLARGARLKDFKSGSPEYKQIEDRMSRELAELQLKTFSRQNELLEREGKIYHETYREIQAAVARIAERYEISLVVRYDSEATDAADRGSIIKAINREVVYQRNLDITKLVIEQVNSPSVASAVETGGARKN